MEVSRKKSWDSKVTICQNSFLRCKNSNDFPKDFYTNLFFLNPKLKDYFNNTDFEHQSKSLMHGLDFLFKYLSNDKEARTQIKRLAIVHSNKSLNIHPHSYYYWIEALIMTLKKHDTKWESDFEYYIRECISLPVNFMITLYFHNEN